MNIFLKWLSLVLIGTSVIVSPLSGRIPLSSESKKSITASTIKGGLVAMGSVGSFFALSALLKGKSLESEEIAAGIIFSALAGVVGATIGSLWKSTHVPEAHFSYAHDELSGISEDSTLVKLFGAEPEQWISIIRAQFCRSRFPLLAAFNHLNAIYQSVESSQKSLKEVANSHRIDLHRQVEELQLFASVISRFLPDVLGALTNEPNFTLECSAKAQQDAAFAQQMMFLTQPHHSTIFVRV